MSGEGPPELTAALQLIDLATARGFSFTLATSGEELPVWGERETCHHWPIEEECLG